MSREPVLLYVLRFLASLGIFFFMAMLYWSSNLLEERTRGLQVQLNELSAQIKNLKVTVLQPAASTESAKSPTASNSDSSIGNLLSVDPFYETTLPEKLLPKGFVAHGVRRTATYGKPDNLHPFSNFADVSAWQSLCATTAGTLHFGIYETYAPDGAFKMEERKNPKTGHPEYWLFLRDDLYWEPLNPKLFPEGVTLAPHFLERYKVTAQDYKFYYDAIMNPFNQEAQAVSLRNYLGDIEEVKVIDDRTLVVRWKTDEQGRVKYAAKGLTTSLMPLASWVYQYFADGAKIVVDDSDPETYRNNSLWAQNFAEHWAKNIIVSCGPWVFDGMSDQEIRFVRNPNYFNQLAALMESSVTQFKSSPDSIWQDFRAGLLDTYIIQPNQLLELNNFLKSDLYKQQEEAGKGIKRLEYVNNSYSYIGWNEARPFFVSKKVRQALTMAIDRQRIIKQILNGLGVEITGTFAIDSPSNDKTITPWPFSPSRARQMLEEEGWYDSDGDGIIDKEIDGKRVPFRFSLTYYVKNPTTKAVCDYIVTALKDVGIACSLRGVDVADLSQSMDDKSFDAISMAWVGGAPPEDPRQLWSSKGAKEKGSSNTIGFANKEVDEIIDKLDYEYDKEKRIALYHRFDAIMHEEQPYTFLYSPKVIMLYRDYLQNVFIPSERQDLVPGANINQPDPSIFWIKN